MISQRPPAILESKAGAAQKPLHGNAKPDCVGENYGVVSGKIRKAAGVSRARSEARGWAAHYDGLPLWG